MYTGTGQQRFIPAGAGNTAASGSSCCGRAVHPRWRGEHFLQFGSQILCNGSSPLARGTRSDCSVRHRVRRFIPAGAGNTFLGGCEYEKDAVHPRWRGEHTVIGFLWKPGIGSSPLARGTLRCGRAWKLSRRFIPAGAGNTSAVSASSLSPAVHPRWRGEHRNPRPKPPTGGGSSPLARGTPGRPSRPAVARRFIPAGAGNTSASAPLTPSTAVHPRWRGEHFRWS